VLTFAAGGASLDAFLSVSGHSPYQPQLEEYLHRLIDQGAVRPEWCVVGFDSGRPVARAALWALPFSGTWSLEGPGPESNAVPTDIVLIECDWNEDRLVSGRALLTELHERARRLSSAALSHHVDTPPGPPQYQENDDARVRLLEDAGYELLRDGLRWHAVSPPADDAGAHALVFRSIREVGEDAFVDAIARTYYGTRDAWLTRNVEQLGPARAAREDFGDAKALEYEPGWWELAYTAEGELAGVIMAARNPGAAVVYYVGVAPEQRGRGIAAQLVRRGTAQLIAAGAKEIRADCDLGNVAMVKAFERAGYERFARRRSFRIALDA
jgi:ribosomal protein S18 acetylase RimI-like enzyme